MKSFVKICVVDGISVPLRFHEVQGVGLIITRKEEQIWSLAECISSVEEKTNLQKAAETFFKENADELGLDVTQLLFEKANKPNRLENLPSFEAMRRSRPKRNSKSTKELRS